MYGLTDHSLPAQTGIASDNFVLPFLRPLSLIASNSDTLSATLSQGWAVGISASGGKGAFPASNS